MIKNRVELGVTFSYRFWSRISCPSRAFHHCIAFHKCESRCRFVSEHQITCCLTKQKRVKQNTCSTKWHVQINSWYVYEFSFCSLTHLINSWYTHVFMFSHYIWISRKAFAAILHEKLWPQYMVSKYILSKSHCIHGFSIYAKCPNPCMLSQYTHACSSTRRGSSRVWAQWQTCKRTVYVRVHKYCRYII